ncbi:extracellular solute-binding protein [Caballeronia sp. SEWSISQ10-4 2]|uniref:extracellular solute-binding protein n=1 Tax=Caballeronia sp. SEWSISQ10-4 2 TaxID=2937438 RepID=UPI00264AF6B9|nr:extracellular solute-binding protein [Caballeronia sp. SEWSISQ10-4 2]MDN7183044.1 extracellular solute-binding protein [Caballeronia sp. SEWSISQ10-4 2]
MNGVVSVFDRRRTLAIACTALSIGLGSLGPVSIVAAQTKTLTEWDSQTVGAGPKIINDAAARFEKANPGFKVESSHVLNDAYKTKLKIAFGANQPPCVFSSWGGGPLREYVKSNQVVDLTPYLQQNAAFQNRFLATAWPAATFDNKVWAIPAENTSVAVVFYNKEIFEKYKLTPPKTWDELLHVISVLKSNNIAPFALANKNKWTGSMYYMYLVDRIGGSDVVRRAVMRAPGGSFADPAFVEAGARVQELVKAGAFAQGFNGLDYDIGASRRLLYSGRAAMELIGSWEASTVKAENPAFYSKLDYFPFPAVPGGKGNPNDVIGTVGDNFYSISKACADPQAAFRLIQAMTDDQSMRERVADTRIPPVKNLEVSDPMLKRFLKTVADAPAVQLWYDQELPPALGELHKNTTQALFGLTTTPQEAAQQMEAEAKKDLN